MCIRDSLKTTTHITNAMALAVYVLYSAKNHAEGCGGDTHVAVIQNDGQNFLLEPEQVRAMETLFEKASDVTDSLLMFAANPIVTPDGLKAAGSVLSESLAIELSKMHSVSSMPELLARLKGKDA